MGYTVRVACVHGKGRDVNIIAREKQSMDEQE